MHLPLRICSNRTTSANPCGIVCFHRENVWVTCGLIMDISTPNGHQRMNVQDWLDCWRNSANCSEVSCCPSFSRIIRGFGSLVIFSSNNAVSSLTTLVGSSLRDGLTVVICTHLASLLVYSSTAVPNCLCESEMQTICSMKRVKRLKSLRV